MSHLLVTNDFPPKIGGIQSYLYELWRRLPAGETTVLTTSVEGAKVFDANQSFRIERARESFLVPTPALVKRINTLADEIDAKIVLLDPAWPLGVIAPMLERPFGVIVHGAEVTIPARLPFVQLLLRKTLRDSQMVVAAGRYPAAESAQAAGRPLREVMVPPGVDVERFQPLSPDARTAARARWHIDESTVAVLCLSRLVPRKGIDTVIHAAARLGVDHPELAVVVAGVGRDRDRLEQLAAATGSPVRFLGKVDDADLPALYGCCDVFAMLCRDRWLGLEQEGFGIVFLEAAAAGIPAIAGLSGGSAEAVIDAVTGMVIDSARDVDAVAEALSTLLDDPALRRRLGQAARNRAVASFNYDQLALTLQAAIDALPEHTRGPDGFDTASSDEASSDTASSDTASAFSMVGEPGLIGVADQAPAPDPTD